MEEFQVMLGVGLLLQLQPGLPLAVAVEGLGQLKQEQGMELGQRQPVLGLVRGQLGLELEQG